MALMEFYGETCPHCLVMKPLVEQIEEELGILVEKYEVWDSEENAEKLDKYNKGLCGGVPFFINTNSGEFICGSSDIEKLRKWAKSE